MSLPKAVRIVEVSPRDGLQNEKKIIPTETKIAFINKLSETGLKSIEVTSFVSPKWVPQLADHDEVFKGIIKNPQVRYSALIPNLQGFENACEVGVKEIAVFTTPSEQFSQHNTHCSVQESLDRIQTVVSAAKKKNIPVRAYISCVLGCPYEGEMSAMKVAQLANTLMQMGCYEISLGDTIGTGTPSKTQQLITTVNKYVPMRQLAVHFHDTYGQALANIYASLQEGITIIDSSVAGLGGCPYAKRASGNVATEDVVYMLHGMQIETGIDLTKLINAGKFILKHLRKRTNSKVSVAL